MFFDSSTSKAAEERKLEVAIHSGPHSAPASDDAIYLRTTIAAAELLDGEDYPPKYQFTVTGKIRKRDKDRPRLGKRVEVDGKELAVFRYGETIFAVDATCPHMGMCYSGLSVVLTLLFMTMLLGGPLDEGDIEELDGRLCITCPWHHYSFCVHSGRGIAPPGSGVEAYPTKIK